MTAVHQWWAGMRATRAAAPSNWVFRIPLNSGGTLYEAEYQAFNPDVVFNGNGTFNVWSDAVSYSPFTDQNTITFTTTGAARLPLNALAEPRYFEVQILSAAGGKFGVGIWNTALYMFDKNAYLGGAKVTGSNISWYVNDGEHHDRYGDPESVPPWVTFAAGDVIGLVAVANTAAYFKNGVFIGSEAYGGDVDGAFFVTVEAP